MKFNEARELLLDEGYRIIGEDFEDGAEFGDVPADLPVEGEEVGELDSDVYGAIEQGLGDEGFDPQETADIMTNFTDKINELVEKGVDTADIVKILAYENCPTEGDDLEEEIPADDGEDLTDVPVDEAYMTEGKSKAKSDKFAHREKAAYKKKKQSCCDEDDDEDLDENYDLYEGKSKPKSDKFAHKEKVAGKKPKGCCGKKGCKDCEDDDLDESTNSIINEIKEILIGRGYNEEGASSWIFVHKNKIADLEEFGYNAEDIVYKLDGSLDESLEDDYPETFRRPNNVQQGTDNWDDFKDNFRAKSLFLKKALTPQFVSGIIKDTDFETDDKEIKAYAFSIIEDVFGTKNPVVNLQARIRKHFVG